LKHRPLPSEKAKSMPQRSKRLCSRPGCSNLTLNRWCDSCAKPMSADRVPSERSRLSAASRGYDAAWRRVRLVALQRDSYLCVACLKEGRVTQAEEVDHIIPMTSGGERLNLDNLQSLCSPCHKNKINTEDGGFGHPKKIN